MSVNPRFHARLNLSGSAFFFCRHPPPHRLFSPGLAFRCKYLGVPHPRSSMSPASMFPLIPGVGTAAIFFPSCFSLRLFCFLFSPWSRYIFFFFFFGGSFVRSSTGLWSLCVNFCGPRFFFLASFTQLVCPAMQRRFREEFGRVPVHSDVSPLPPAVYTRAPRHCCTPSSHLTPPSFPPRPSAAPFAEPSHEPSWLFGHLFSPPPPRPC